MPSGFLELLLAGGIAGTFGLLMALVWTAGFVPTFLEPRGGVGLPRKPIARWQLLLGNTWESSRSWGSRSCSSSS